MRYLVVSLILVSCIVASVSSRARSVIATCDDTSRSYPQDSPTPTPTPTPDPELDEAKRQTALDQERQKQAEARKAETDANNSTLKGQIQPLGAANVTVPSGNVSTDQAGFVEVQMLAQEAANQIASKLALSLCGKKVLVSIEDANGKPIPSPVPINTLVVYSSADIAALAYYRPMIDQLKQVETDFNTKDSQANILLSLTNPAIPPPDLGPLDLAAPGAATAVVKSVAELVNLFRTDTQFQNKTVSITDDMVVSYLIDTINTDLCKVKPAVYYPALYPPLLFSSGKSDLIQRLASVSALRTAASTNGKNIDDRIALINTIAGNIDKLKSEQKDEKDKEKQRDALKDPKCKTDKCKELTKQITDLQSQIETDNAAINKQTGNNPTRFQDNYKDWLAKLNKIKPQIQSLIDSADKIIVLLNTPDSSNKLTALATLLAAERLGTILQNPTSFTLRASVTANGTTKIKKNIFVDAKVRHSAGADLAYQLFDFNGGVALGGAMHCYFDYQSAQDVRNAVSNLVPIKCTSK